MKILKNTTYNQKSRTKKNFNQKDNSKPHILVISQYFHPEIFRINDITVEWVKRGYKVTVLTGIPNYPAGKFFDGYNYTHRRIEQWKGINIIRIPLIPRGTNSIGMIANYFSFVGSGWLWKMNTRIRADLVFTFEVSPMTQALLGCWYSKKYQVPHFLYVQDLWPENVETITGIKCSIVIELINRMVDYIYKNTNKIFTTSPSFVKLIVNRKIPVPLSKVHYWPQYAEDFYQVINHKKAKKGTERSSSIQFIPNDNVFNIIFTGNIGTAQGLDILPKTAAKLKKSHTYKNVRFIIVGDGRYQKDFKAEIRQRNVEDSFIMIPQQTPEDIPELLACCDAAFLSFKNSKLWEFTIPAKLQSYMACGMPIIAAAKGETAKIINEAQCGLCCEPENSKELKKIIELVLNKSQEELIQMGKNSRKYFDKYFNKVKLMDEMDRYIQYILER